MLYKSNPILPFNPSFRKKSPPCFTSNKKYYLFLFIGVQSTPLLAVQEVVPKAMSTILLFRFGSNPSGHLPIEERENEPLLSPIHDEVAFCEEGTTQSTEPLKCLQVLRQVNVIRAEREAESAETISRAIDKADDRLIWIRRIKGRRKLRRTWAQIQISHIFLEVLGER